MAIIFQRLIVYRRIPQLFYPSSFFYVMMNNKTPFFPQGDVLPKDLKNKIKKEKREGKK